MFVSASIERPSSYLSKLWGIKPMSSKAMYVRPSDPPTSGLRGELTIIARRFCFDAVLPGRHVFCEQFDQNVLPRYHRGPPHIWSLISDIKIHMVNVRKLTIMPYSIPTLLLQRQAILGGIRAANPRLVREFIRNFE